MKDNKKEASEAEEVKVIFGCMFIGFLFMLSVAQIFNGVMDSYHGNSCEMKGKWKYVAIPYVLTCDLGKWMSEE
jgi:hypothetical protein